MRKTLFTNARIFRPDNNFHSGDIAIQNGFFTNDFSQADESVNCENLYLIPGLCDIHFHGCMGHDFCDATQESLAAIANYEQSIGVTSICPATMTLAPEKLLAIMKSAREFHERNHNFVGINLEGPFISREKPGSQDTRFIIPPDINLLRNLQQTSGNLIKLVDIAPEIPGAFDFVTQARELAKISFAHSNSDYDTAKKFFDELGINHVTHLYNAMKPINHREPGAIIAALENPNVMVELICDGIHVHPAIVRNTFRIFGDDRVIMISDSTSATGMPDGKYTLGESPIVKKANAIYLANSHEKILAGSATNLADCVRIAVKNMGVKLESAIKCATINPAKSIGLEKFLGSIEPGKIANLVALDQALNLKFVFST